jgi:heme exporter protein B|tara:strand:+ start:181 stop:843 length:663 start_codon:yes stop_codon:yes gene_type:complete
VKALLQRELIATLRTPGSVTNPLGFLLLSLLLFAVVDPSAKDAQNGYLSGIFWVLILLTNMLSLDAMFRRDYDSGALEQMLISAHMPFVAVLMRIFVHWLGSGLLMTLFVPLFGLLLGLDGEVVLPIMLVMVVGTPALSLLGSIGAALTVGFSRGGAILALLILPLFLPVLIFGSACISTAASGLSFTAPMTWLALVSSSSLLLAPWATWAALKISVEMQ